MTPFALWDEFSSWELDAVWEFYVHGLRNTPS